MSEQPQYLPASAFHDAVVCYNPNYSEHLSIWIVPATHPDDPQTVMAKRSGSAVD